MITRKNKLCKCGCGKEGKIWAKGMLQPCHRKHYPPKPIKKVSKKKLARIKESKSYYQQAIEQNMQRNGGKCLCDECSGPITNPTGKHHGRAVCHIVSGGSNETLYMEPENHFILGRGPLFKECNCGWVYDESGRKETMRIYPRHVEVKEKLIRKYYDSSNSIWQHHSGRVV